MQDYVILFLPVAWALIATLIGIVLYKSSDAFFEQTSGQKNQKRTLRLTGSVVIAALAFYGIKNATPDQNLLATAPGMLQVSIAELQSIESKLEENINDLLILESCLELDQTGNCRDQLVRLQSRFRDAKHILGGMLNDNRQK
ncbi:MAG: hypothetical protein methR_P3020 [Methyloprofundus sp.]|nr:MAG: hypothetical protein methR_P3020 [Methyloprofundus sp.]